MPKSPTNFIFATVSTFECFRWFSIVTHSVCGPMDSTRDHCIFSVPLTQISFCLILYTTVSIQFMTLMPETIREKIYGNQWVLLSSRDESKRSLVLAVEGLFQILYLQDMLYCCWVIWFQKTSHIFSQFLMYCSLLACRGLEHELKETQKVKKVKDLKKKKKKKASKIVKYELFV